MKKCILFTGGGSAGHVTPNFPLMEYFGREGWQVEYMGSKEGIERDLIEKAGISFHGISNGKWRRYFSVKNFLDPFKIIGGIYQSYKHMKKLQPAIVFSKGGFVAFPVVVGAWLNNIPVVAHESDRSPGLSNALCMPFIKTLCVTFEETGTHITNKNKLVITGTPVREALFKGDRQKGLALCGFQPDKICLLFMGGGAGAESINKTLRTALPELQTRFQIIHLCGKGKLDSNLEGLPFYKQFEYVDETLPDLYACADLVISRSGANSVYEILALAKPHILIPLSSKVSRGDQILNARYFEKKGVSVVIDDELLNAETLTEAINHVLNQKEVIKEKIFALGVSSATQKIVDVLKNSIRQ